MLNWYGWHVQTRIYVTKLQIEKVKDQRNPNRQSFSNIDQCSVLTVSLRFNFLVNSTDKDTSELILEVSYKYTGKFVSYPNQAYFGIHINGKHSYSSRWVSCRGLSVTMLVWHLSSWPFYLILDEEKLLLQAFLWQIWKIMPLFTRFLWQIYKIGFIKWGW